MKLTTSLVLAAIAAVALPLAQDTGNLLRRKLEANSADVYKIESKGKQIVNGPTGEQEVNITTTATYSLKYGKVDSAANTADVDATVSVDKMDMDGPAAGMAPPKPEPVTMKGKIDSRNRITLEAPKTGMSFIMSGMQSNIQSGLFIELPEKAVKVGDTWEMLVPKSPMTSPEDQHLTAKLIGEKEVDGKSVWVVSVSGTIKSSVDTSKLPKDEKSDVANPMAAMKMVIKGSVEMTGEGLVDKETGKTISMKSTGKTKSTMEMPDAGMSFDIGGTMDTTVTLQKS